MRRGFSKTETRVIHARLKAYAGRENGGRSIYYCEQGKETWHNLNGRFYTRE